MSDERKDTPKWLVVVQKVTSIGSGESIQISTNLDKTATRDDLKAALSDICWALDERLVEQNEKVLAITAATREALAGISVEDQPL